MKKLILSAVVVLMAVAASPAADDKKKVENPIFKSWAKYKPGTSVVMKTSLDAGGMPLETVTTTTLVEVKDDKVVVEVESVTKFMGKETKAPATKQDLLKEYEVGKVPDTDPKVKPEGKTEDGKKKLKVGGTEFECQWVKYTGKEVESETYISDDVPGMMVKTVSKAKTGGMTMEVTEVNIKK